MPRPSRVCGVLSHPCYGYKSMKSFTSLSTRVILWTKRGSQNGQNLLMWGNSRRRALNLCCGVLWQERSPKQQSQPSLQSAQDLKALVQACVHEEPDTTTFIGLDFSGPGPHLTRLNEPRQLV